ncbi:MAG: hypothetical protein NVV82_13880 [Sporocytophaga sp.]|jgi:hypothetical protein|nr:hypothetical protein [Sporocytophaga sp.]
MCNQVVVNLLAAYGVFLILCGIVSVIFIGLKAKTALISGGTSGVISIIISVLMFNQVAVAKYAGIMVVAALFVVFSWRSTKTLFTLMEMISTSHEDRKGKAIAFLIISLMAVVSIFAIIMQIVFWC